MPTRTSQQQYQRTNQARLNELEARKNQRWAENPLSAFFSDWVGEGADEQEEAETRTFRENALADGESMDELKRKVGYKPKKSKLPWEKWEQKQ